MKHSKIRIFIAFLFCLGFFYLSKVANSICLIPSLNSIGSGYKSVFYFNDLHKLAWLNNCDANGALTMVYKIYNNTNIKIDHIDILYLYNITDVRYHLLFDVNSQLSALYLAENAYLGGNLTNMNSSLEFFYESVNGLTNVIYTDTFKFQCIEK